MTITASQVIVQPAGAGPTAVSASKVVAVQRGAPATAKRDGPIPANYSGARHHRRRSISEQGDHSGTSIIVALNAVALKRLPLPERADGQAPPPAEGAQDQRHSRSRPPDPRDAQPPQGAHAAVVRGCLGPLTSSASDTRVDGPPPWLGISEPEVTSEPIMPVASAAGLVETLTQR